MKLFMGIDTSCYTTSVAVVDEEGNLLADERQLLPVPSGKRGLAQSQALFYHVQNLPMLLRQIGRRFSGRVIGIAASTRPRPVKGSYMPVFTVAEGYGSGMAAIMGVDFYATTHQEGHLMAGLWSAGVDLDNFLAVHLSGGTSELLRVKSASSSEHYFEIELLGGTTDLHAGQFIDRVGVAMGLPFPAGPHLEELAQSVSQGELRIPTWVKGFQFSFSGPETHARRLLKRGAKPEHVARAIEHCVAATVEKIVRKAVEEYGLRHVLIVGGVASNRYLRQHLTKKLEHRAVGAKLYFAQPRFSTDNAVGTALLGLKQFCR